MMLKDRAFGDYLRDDRTSNRSYRGYRGYDAHNASSNLCCYCFEHCWW